MRNVLCFLLLGVINIVVGILGSCFLSVVFGTFLIYKAVSLLLLKKRNVIKTVASIPFFLVFAYFAYYSSAMLFSELNYAVFRPKIWLILPFSVVFIFLVTLMSVDRDKNSEEHTQITEYIVGLHIENIIVFAVVFAGYIGTFVLHFYFEYAACISVIVCLLNAIAEQSGLKKYKHTDKYI